MTKKTVAIKILYLDKTNDRPLLLAGAAWFADEQGISEWNENWTAAPAAGTKTPFLYIKEDAAFDEVDEKAITAATVKQITGREAKALIAEAMKRAR